VRASALLLCFMMLVFVFIFSAIPIRIADAGPPSGVLYYVPITLNNTQSSATPSNFQQMLNINFSAYSTYINSACSNIGFFSSTWVPLNAWLENASSTCNTDKNDIVWVNMSSFTIPATSTITIYMGFYSTSTNNFGSVWGEAPQLSSTYAQYDNGANVFPWYENFKGTTLPSDLTQIGGGGTLTVNNGLNISVSDSNGIYIYKTSGISSSSATVLDAYIFGGGAGGATESYIVLAFSLGPVNNGYPQTAVNNGYYADIRVGATSGLFDIFVTSSGSPTDLAYTTGDPTQTQIVTMMWPATGIEKAFTTYNNTSLSATDTRFSLPSTTYPLFGVFGNGAAGAVSSYWMRARLYPPNGVMPSATFGSLTQSDSPTTIDTVNIQLLADGMSTAISAGNCFTVLYYDNSSTQSSTSICDGNVHTINANDSSQITILAQSTGSTLRESWQFTLPASNVTFSASNSTFIYYYFDLLSQNIAFNLVGGGSPSYPNVTYTSAPQSSSNATDSPTQYNLTLSASYQTIWPERSTGYFVTPNPILNGTTERWMAAISSWATPQSGNVQATYYHQYLYNLTFNVNGPSGWSPPLLTSTQNGTSYTPTLTQSYASYWLDNSTSWSVSNPLPGSTQTNYWKDNIDATSGTVSSSLTYNFTYQWGYSIPFTLTSGPFANAFCLQTSSAGPYNITFQNMTSLNAVYSNDTNFWFYGFPSSSSVRFFNASQVPFGYLVITGNQSFTPPPGLQAGTNLCIWVPTSASQASTSLGFGPLNQVAPRIIAPFGSVLGGNQYFFSLIYTLITIALYLRVRSSGFIAVWLLLTSPVMGAFIAPELRMMYVVSLGLAIGMLIYTVVKRTEYT
jgi:hypothetical protein